VLLSKCSDRSYKLASRSEKTEGAANSQDIPVHSWLARNT